MRRALLVVAIGVLGPGLAVPAWAGPFGGFSRDGSVYLEGTDQVCQPVTGEAGAPRCRKAAAAEVTRLGFAKGTAERGAGAAVAARLAAGAIEIVAQPGGEVLARWRPADPATRVIAVYRSKDGRRAAVEYEVRAAGRAQTRTVALPLRAASAGGAAAGAGAAPAPSGPVPPPARPGAAEDKEVVAAVRAADRLLRKKAWKKAEAAYRSALDRAGDHAAARFGLAAALARQGKKVDAVAELALLARSPLQGAPVWLVEARTSAHFKPLRSDGAFRRAVGLDPDPSRPASAYERLVGHGGHWEQTGLPCQDPTVTLKLDRATMKFSLVIRTRCQGMDERTRLGGTWKASGADALELVFPNPGGAEERLECGLADDGKEDALTCVLQDVSFTMRVVRR